MAKSTPEEFTDALYSALSWRRAELQVLKSLVSELDAGELDKPYARMVLRSGVALLYAHWEGFAKQILQYYLDYVAKRRLRYRELRPELVITAVRPVLERSVRDKQSLGAFAKKLFSLAESRASLPKTGVVETGSNLRYERLVEILSALGLDAGPFETRQNLIDVRLCDARNDIAHGGFSVPDRTGLLELIDIVLNMMNELLTQVSNAVAMKAYRSE